MSEGGVPAAAPLSLGVLRSEGAQRFDPVRFHYMEVLARRLQNAPFDVRSVLQGKLNEALTDYAERFSQVPSTAEEAGTGRTGPRLAKASCSPLAQLNQHLRQLSQQPAEPGGMGSQSGGGSDDRTEMKSLRGFRESWAKIAAQDQLDKAVGRGPQNAGPLNSHLLVLRSLALMRDLSPDYLRRFLSHLDALLWLDQASQPLASAGARSAKRIKKEK